MGILEQKRLQVDFGVIIGSVPALIIGCRCLRGKELPLTFWRAHVTGLVIFVEGLSL